MTPLSLIRTLIAIAIVSILAACATTSQPGEPPAAGPLLQLVIDDFTAARDTFASHAAAAPAGSALQAKLRTAAACMEADLAKLRPSGPSATSSVAGVVSLGAVAYVGVLEAQARSGPLLADSAACDQLTGQIVRGINAQAVRALPGFLLRRM